MKHARDFDFIMGYITNILDALKVLTSEDLINVLACKTEHNEKDDKDDVTER
jgi:hypothetical protein